MNEVGRISYWVFSWGWPLLAGVWLYRQRTRGRLLLFCGLLVAAVTQYDMHALHAAVAYDLPPSAAAVATYWKVQVALLVVYSLSMIVALVGFARIVRREDNEGALE